MFWHCVRSSVTAQVNVLSKYLNSLSWFSAHRMPSTYPTLCCKGTITLRILWNQIIPNTEINRFLLAFSSRHVDHRKCRQRSLNVTNSTRWAPIFVYNTLAVTKSVARLSTTAETILYVCLSVRLSITFVSQSRPPNISSKISAVKLTSRRLTFPEKKHGTHNSSWILFFSPNK